jgi:hypothetical protein
VADGGFHGVADGSGFFTGGKGGNGEVIGFAFMLCVHLESLNSELEAIGL